MKYFYDFHIHSALSPCSDDDNTPANIVNMAKLKGLDVIAVSDHNSVKNCRAAMYHGRKNGVLVLPAMELTTSEDIHILCLFVDISGAEDFEKYISKNMLIVKNKPSIFGNQYIYDNNDNICGTEEKLLGLATEIPSYKAADILTSFGGVAIPAHIDRPSNSILQTLGGIDKSMNFKTLEINSKNVDIIKKYSKDYSIITDSDAHTLGLISEAENSIELSKLNQVQVLKTLI